MLSLTLALLSLALQPPEPASTDAAAPAATSASTAAAAPAATDVETIKGAPTDDYGFVAWCRGALTGHMELYKQVKPEMDKVEFEKGEQQDKSLKTAQERAAAKAARAKDAKDSERLDGQQLAAGRDYIALYNRALKAAEAASPTPIQPRGVEATAQGYRIWSAARAADDRTGMWSYIMWELPARCETSAKTLEANSGLLGEAFKTSAAVPPATIPAPVETGAAAEDATTATPAPATTAKPRAKATPKAKIPAPPPLRTTPQG